MCARARISLYAHLLSIVPRAHLQRHAHWQRRSVQSNHENENATGSSFEHRQQQQQFACSAVIFLVRLCASEPPLPSSSSTRCRRSMFISRILHLDIVVQHVIQPKYYDIARMSASLARLEDADNISVRPTCAFARIFGACCAHTLHANEKKFIAQIKANKKSHCSVHNVPIAHDFH